MKRLIVLVVIVFFFPLAFAKTQTDKTGKIKGLVLDRHRAVVVYAKITIKGKHRKLSLAPDKQGQFEVSLPQGIYEITVESQGFRLSKQKVQVRGGAEIEQEFMLETLPVGKCPPGKICL